MSADNFIAVWQESPDSWAVSHGFMSEFQTNNKYKGSVSSLHSDKQTAWQAAYELEKELEVVEYGILDLQETHPIQEKLLP